LNLVGSQNKGLAPNELADVIAPTIDLGPMYLVSRQEAEAAIIAAPANGINNAITVPTGEVWRVNFGGAFCATPAGVTLDWALAANLDGGAMPLADTLSQAASQTRLMAMKSGPIWLTGGQSLGVYITNLVGVPTFVSVSFNISRMRA
jgi:hypothetical protein